MSAIIFGIHSIEEALNSEQEIDKVFILKGTENESITKLTQQVQSQGIAISKVPIQKLDKLANGNHQGIVAKISPIQTIALSTLIENAMETEQNPIFLLLDEITDVRNFGAIVRTAECAGASGIIIPKQGSAAINEQAVKTSAGAIFNIPITKVPHLKDALFYLKSYDVQIVGATEKSTHSIYTTNFKQPTAIIMGSEGKGISNSLIKMCDVKAKIPLIGQTDSLNVSVAAALFLYEAVRQNQ